MFYWLLYEQGFLPGLTFMPSNLKNASVFFSMHNLTCMT